jgi:SAM-dependent methyltransferase
VGTVKDHYDSFLGRVYSWILGDFETAYQKNVELFAELNLTAKPGDFAVDLGCGPGCQTLPLAELGYEVLSIDFCLSLLEELHDRVDGSAVKIVCDDVLNFPDHLAQQADLIVCMGDTLVHLPNRQAVRTLIARVCESLNPGGKFIYAIRDYVDYVPVGADRFIPIRASDEQIFTCFLDYKDDVVHVHDVLHQKLGDEWHMKISDYLKLRLDSADLDDQLRAHGLTIRSHAIVDGMITVVAEKA